MNRRDILIRILATFQDNGVQKGINVIQSGFQNVVGGLGRAISTITLWDTIFGRVTRGMLTWQAWRSVVDGFQALGDAVINGNAKLQVARNTFAALAGGSKEAADTYIEILRQASIQTGARFDELLDASKRLPTQVGQNFQAFSDLTKIAITLGMIDPVQGVEGAMFALTNAMEGTAAGFRSLLARFEIGSMEQVKRLLQDTENPLEAIKELLKESGINTEKFIAAQLDTWPVAVKGLQAMSREFIRIAGEPAITFLTDQLVKLRNWVQENSDAFTGLSRAIGSAGGNFLADLGSFTQEVFFAGGLDPMKWFDAGVNLLTQLADGMLTALTDYVIPTVVNIATFIAGFFIGASPPPLGPLSQIKEGGKETIKQYVLGLIEGLSSSEIEQLAEGIRQNVINLEGQELAQEKSVQALEKYVKEAESIVRNARLRLQLFDIMTADIPERFTRGRRRQLELAVIAAEQEKQRRQDALDAAREQLAATKRILTAQRQVLSLLEQQYKAKLKLEEEDAKGKGIDKSLVPIDLNTADFENAVKEWQAIFAKKLEPLFTRLKTGFGDIGDFIRGVMGVSPDVERGFTDMYNQGAKLRDALIQIADGFRAIIENAQTVGGKISEMWNSLTPEMQKLILIAAGAIVAPKAFLVLNLLATAANPNASNILKLLGSILFVSGAGGAIVNILFKITAQLLGGLASALLAGLTGPAVGAALPFIALTVGIIVLISEIYYGREELGKWFTGQRILEATVVITAILGDQLKKFLQWIEDKTPGVPQGSADALGSILDDALKATTAQTQNNPYGLQAFGGLLGQNILQGIYDSMRGGEKDISTAAEESTTNPVATAWENLKNFLVGNSIVPEMLTEIVRLFQAFPFQMTPHLASLELLMSEAMNAIRINWTGNWLAMAATAQSTIDALSVQMEYLTQMAAAQTAGVIGGEMAQSQNQPSSINLTLDAEETQRLMQEGVYAGLMEVV